MKNFLETGPEFLSMMRMSIYPPHVKEHQNMIPDAAFPICAYAGQEEGIKVKEYQNDKFCSSFQTTFNDHGLCYTFNNVQQRLESSLERNDTLFKIRTVSGCGKESGLQLIIDNHKINSLMPTKSQVKGYKAFVTLPGVVTSKIPFHVDPRYEGEHNFYLHGIHVIKASEQFREWNSKNKLCYFPDDRNLTYFNHYSQDACLLECKLSKISAICKCEPWYMFAGKEEKSSTAKICGRKGINCFHKNLKKYKDDLSDRAECDCRNDCEMVHHFATLQREPFETNKNARDAWFNPETGKGILANYLLDPADGFTDRLSKNITKLVHNLSSDLELATERFKSDIAVLNFFFDTPIITRIRMELRTSVFDMISAVGGTLGLFTGISVITLVEVIWWSIQFCVVAVRKAGRNAKQTIRQRVSDSSKEELPKVTIPNGSGKYEVPTV